MLRAAGFSSDLSSGAKALVRVEQYQPMLEAIRIGGLDLKPRHVLCSTELEEEVLAAIKRIPRQEKVRRKKRSTKVPLGFAVSALARDLAVDVVRSFISIKVPSSLRSDSASGVATASTTDAKIARGEVKATNPRKA